MTILSLFFIVVVAYFIIGYKQLFGYSALGTLWRLAFVFGFVYCVALLLSHLVFFSGPAPDIQVAGHSFPAYNFMICFYIFFGALFFCHGLPHQPHRHAQGQTAAATLIRAVGFLLFFMV